MKRRTFVGLSGLAAAGAALGSRQAGAESPRQPPKPSVFLNPFEQEGTWYKAALHVHTTTSDGDVDVATRLAQYRKAGYQVVAVTDHWKTNDLTGLSDAGFLAINSMEAHPQTGTGAPAHHFVCLDLPHPFELSKTLSAQALIDTVRTAGGKVVYAHPYWTAHSIAEMLEVGGYAAVEVYNAHCDLASRKGFNQAHADQLFNRGILAGLTAVDDVHKSAWLNVGWTMIRARSLTKADVMDAFAKGCTYASCGPAIEDFRVGDGTVRLRCSPVAEIRFHFNGSGGGRLHEAPHGETITTAEWKFAGGRKSPEWIRAEVVDPAGKHAWTNPLAIAPKA
jgi:hypothetical protein